MEKITGIHHLAIKCCGISEFNKTVDFYTNILGLKVARSWGEVDNSAIMLDTGAGLLEIFANGEDRPQTGFVRHFAFDVTDTDQFVNRVRKAGYEITMEPNDISIPSNPPYNARIAFCKGPVGEEIEFFQVK